MSDDEANALAAELTAEFSKAIETDRRNEALLALDNVERIDHELREASSITKQAIEAVNAAKTADEVVELAQRWGPRLLTVWAMARAGLGH